MSAARQASLVQAAQARRDAGDWPSALRLFGQADAIRSDPVIKHNLALGHFSVGKPAEALAFAAAAVRLAPGLWQAHALAARIHRGQGRILETQASLRAALAADPGNGTALLGLADLEMNEFGDAAGARALVAPLARDPNHAVDAELTELMSLLYDRGGETPQRLSARLAAFSKAALRVPAVASAAERGRIGILSPLLSASPVYFLTFSTFEALSREFPITVFNRGTRNDWATDAFRGIARGWHDVAHLDAAGLAARIAGEGIDLLFDLGGWSDPIGLAACSAVPAPRIFSWVGGQSATTGVESMAWVGDAWQNPPALDGLYAERIVRIAGGYVDYRAPPILAGIAARAGAKRGAVLAGNPVKIGAAAIAAWPEGVDRVTLLDRRYVHDLARERVTALLAEARIEVDDVIVPHGHAEYLGALARFESLVDTRPYNAGLTAVEAMALGVQVVAGGREGALFCERHQLSHARTGGRNAALAGQMIALAGADS